MIQKEDIKWFVRSILFSYSQVFFSAHKTFGIILLVFSFVDFYTGLFGLLSVVTTTFMARWMGFDKFKIQQGYYGFNSLLVGLGMGIYFQPGLLLLLLVIIASVLTLFISVSFEGIIGKYGLPYLSLPFVLSLWVLMLASREFHALGLSQRGIYTLNDLYLLGGPSLVWLYEWWAQIPFPATIRSYFLSLGAIFFQSNVFTGILISFGLLIFSRIAFSLSLIGFYTALLFYWIIGATFSEVSYSYIGFNYILSAIAIGGYFIIPNRSSYLWVMLLIPMVAILTISLSSILAVFHLPAYSLPFNIIALLFLYVLKFRLHNRIKLNTIFVQQNSPEKNLYSFNNYMERFEKHSPVPIYLPFFGEWQVTQAHDGEYTHKNDWRHAWDFEIIDENGKTYKNNGDFPEDYYCYDKIILAPASGQVHTVVDNISDNIIGRKNLEKNWGNTVVIKHNDFLYSVLSHLKPGSVSVKEGEKVDRATPIGRCGNSGNSPYPHLHFQMQATASVGSKTLDYPISNYLVKQNEKQVLKVVGTPKKADVVSNIQPKIAFKKAFSLIPGEKIQLTVDIEGSTYDEVWEIKQDFFLNKYIECEKSQCKAWFRNDDAMLYFTHFEGKRHSLLYYFYLAAYRVCMDHFKGLDLTDSYPANAIYDKWELLLQDFIAPFWIFRKSNYRLKVIALSESLADTNVLLEATSSKITFGTQKNYCNHSIPDHK
jgi:urea transporter/murein DD-endopeptidase MepM/ murein hydrolase activator NlpD